MKCVLFLGYKGRNVQSHFNYGGSHRKSNYSYNQKNVKPAGYHNPRKDEFSPVVEQFKGFEPAEEIFTSGSKLCHQ